MILGLFLSVLFDEDFVSDNRGYQSGQAEDENAFVSP